MMNAKKLFQVVGLSLLSVSSVYAATSTPNKAAANGQQGTNMQQKPATRTTTGVINPPARPILGNGVDFFIDGDFLYWKARETGLDFATKTTYPVAPGQALPAGQFINNYSGDVKTPHFDWDPGFRIGVGFNMPFDGWDIYLDWTRFHTKYHHGTTSADPSFGKRILPEFQPVVLPNENMAYNYAQPAWKLHYDNLDLELGREFFVSRRLTLRPFIGLRTSWINQKYEVNVTGSGTVDLLDGGSPESNTLALTTTTEMHCDFNGLGPRAGLNTEWRLGAGLSFFGDAAIALLLGDFNVKYSSEANGVFNPAGQTVGVTTLTESFHDTRPVADIDLGIRWQRDFGDYFRIRLQVGWESHIYFDQNQFISFENVVYPTTDDTDLTTNLVADTTRRGDLSLQGLTVSLRFDF